MYVKPSSYLSSVGYADDEDLTRLLQTSFLFLVALPVLVIFDSFLLQVLPDIVHPDSSCKSFLVSIQAVACPPLVGKGGRWVLKDILVGQGGRWVLKDLFHPKVSF